MAREALPLRPEKLYTAGVAQRAESPMRGLRISLFIHLGLVLFIILRNLIFWGDTDVRPPALRVDLVDLPQVLKKDLNQIPLEVGGSKAQPEPEPTPEDSTTEEAKPGEMVQKRITVKKRETKKRDEATKKEMQTAMDRIKALAKLRALQVDEEPSEKEGAVVRGNILSAGTSLSSDAVESMTSSFTDRVRDVLLKHWKLPIWLERRGLNATVLIFVNETGAVTQIKFLRSSDNKQFDQAVQAAIEASSPLPLPPDDIRENILSGGIQVGFPLLSGM